MLLRPEYLSKKLDQPLPTKDGGTLRIILDARTYMLALSKDLPGPQTRLDKPALRRMER
jgi:hypothetical protein